jgi:hypothetical protein
VSGYAVFDKADQLTAAEVVMTPSKRDKTTVIRIEKVKRTNIDEAQVAHKAGGQHSGLVINKQAVPGLLINFLIHEFLL